MTGCEKLRCVVLLSLIWVFWILSQDRAVGDWLTCRSDSLRSGTTSETLKVPLEEGWVHVPVHAPQPAWPEMPARVDVYRGVKLGPTVVFDRAFHPVIVGDSLCFGSSADDTVYCLDVSTGRMRWSCTTEGPIRLAPALAGGRAYVGSDDGCVYCLDTRDGRLLWRHRVGPEDRRLPGNGRMISLWPVRCGVVVDDGTVYVAAGLFPSQGAYLCALDAENGRELWKQQVDISTQGYLVASSERLYVPTGRTPPHIYSRTDGRQIAAFPGIGQQRSGTPEGGGCFAVLVGDRLMHSGGEKGGLQVTDARSREKIVHSSGLRVVSRGPMAYIVDHESLRAVDRTLYIELLRLQAKKEKTPEDKKRIEELQRDPGGWLRWQSRCLAPYELILAGETIFAGGDDQVVAFDAATGNELWSGEVQGKAYALAASNGRLFVGTDQGRIHCFAPQAASVSNTDGALEIGETPAPSPPSPYPDDRLTPLYQRTAELALKAAGTSKGYCVVLGARQGRLSYEIATRSDLRVIGVEPDAENVAAARRRLRKAGLYGSRVVIHHRPLDRLPYQKRFANLIVSEETLLSGTVPTPASEVYRVMRPCGGAAVLVQRGESADARTLSTWAGETLPGCRLRTDANGSRVLVATRGSLPGAGEWTHLYADAGNSACSNDGLQLGPVDIQWFGRPGPRTMVDRHEKNVGPLYKNGRLFVSGDNYIVTVDAYNGTVLWEQALPESIRLGALKDCGSMAVTDDCLYVAAGSKCVGFDVTSGKRKCMLNVPGSVASRQYEWGYVAAVNDILLGSVAKPGATFRVQDVPTQTLIWRDNQPVVTSESLFALDRHTGEARWTYTPEQGVIVNPAIAVAGSRVCFVESTNRETRHVFNGQVKLDMLLGKGVNLTALDVSTGKKLWSTPVDLSQLQHVIFLSYARDTLVITGSKNVRIDGCPRVRYDLIAFDAATGKRLWQRTEKPIPDHILQGPHGEQVQHSAIVGDTIYNTGFALKLRTGEPISGWKWQKSDKCGTISASTHCVLSRYSNPRMFDLKTGDYRALTQVTRPGCWINMIPAGGMILIPEASSGCTCYYSIQTSLALSPRDSRP